MKDTPGMTLSPLPTAGHFSVRLHPLPHDCGTFPFLTVDFVPKEEEQEWVDEKRILLSPELTAKLELFLWIIDFMGD
ncbi:hypothetical protein CEXT_798691 [Caerostris extrusa]|uniref:Uncharacterized protein n=1 Tax=Caerostris extrusa TaxID=172846 RepID=A0AAV4XVA0_CAEEX|nr:hypothetical protein CEXT_798691 [Caerostris extrusa]